MSQNLTLFNIKKSYKNVTDAVDVLKPTLCKDNQQTHLFDLAGLASRLDVLEVHLLVLGEVDDRAQEIEKPWKVRVNFCILKRNYF